MRSILASMSVITLVAAAVSMTGCAGGDEPDKETTSTSSDEGGAKTAEKPAKTDD